MDFQDYLAIAIVWGFLIFVWHRPVIRTTRTMLSVIFLKLGKVGLAMKLRPTSRKNPQLHRS